MKRKIEEKVEKIRNEFNLDEKYYFDIVQIAKKLGFTIGNAYLQDEDGFLIVDSKKKKKIIGVNEKSSLFLKRYILACALGTFHLEENQDNKAINNIYLYNEDIDINVKYFATSLLLPKDSFCKIYQELKKAGVKGNHLYTVLSELYEVPVELIKYRKDELLSQKKKTTLATYYQKCEDKEIDGAIKTLSKIKIL